MSTAEFQSQVLKHYQEKRASDQLDFASPKPTTAKIKRGCEEALANRFDTRDEPFLRSYFKPKEGQRLDLAIQHFPIDRFRPLNYYLRDHSKNPDFKHIKLLAWLIDFPARPYRSSYETHMEASETEDVQPPVEPPKEAEEDTTGHDKVTGDPSGDLSEDTTSIDDDSVKVDDGYSISEVNELSDEENVSQIDSHFKKLGGYWYYPVAIILSLWLGVRVVSELNVKGSDRRSLTSIPVIGQKGCVVWNDDHYEPAACSSRASVLGSFGVDTGTVRKLRRITMPDTITRNSIKRLWYTKIDGQIEYFTAPGFHPSHPDRVLKPLTIYMYNKYLYHYADKTTGELALMQKVRNWLTW